MRQIVILILSFSLSFCTGHSTGKDNSGQRNPEEVRQTITDQQTTEPVKNALTLAIDQTTARPGAKPCVNITVADFQNLISMQYSIRWDSDVLEYKSIQGPGLPFLGPQNFGTHRTGEGILTFVWIDETLKGVDLPDGSSIFQICYQVKGQSGQSGYIAFSENPTPFEVVNVREEVLPLNGLEGSITVK